jgi:hypothetical protein
LNYTRNSTKASSFSLAIPAKSLRFRRFRPSQRPLNLRRARFSNVQKP